MPETVVTEQFLEELRLLPRNLSQKCLRLIAEIRSAEGPTLGQEFSPGWRLHSLQKSPFLSASIDMNFRVLMRRVGGRMVLCRVLKHDDAYKPSVLAGGDTGNAVAVTSQPILPKELYAALLGLGIPAGELRPLLNVADENALADALESLPSRLGELALQLYEEDLLVFQKTHYVALGGSDELIEILKKPLGEWETYLHPTQRYVVALPCSLFAAIEGSAGTGKTICAIHRAAELLKDGIRVRFACGNHQTIELLSSLLARNSIVAGDRLTTVVLPLRGGRASLARFLGEPECQVGDHIIIDEAQDLSASWFTESFPKQEGVGVTIFYDWNQASTTWTSKTIQKNMSAARSEWRELLSSRRAVQLGLSINYRNSRSIAAFSGGNFGTHLPDYTAPEASLFDAGPVVELSALGDAMAATLVVILKNLLRDFPPDEIGIVDMGYGSGTGDQTQVSMFTKFRGLAAALEASGVRCVPIRSEGPAHGSIVYGFPHEFKGFERKAVVMVADRNMALAQPSNIRAMMYHYMAATRARDRLVLLREEPGGTTRRDPEENQK